MKKLLFSGLTALMMLFSLAYAQDKAQVKVTGDPDTVTVSFIGSATWTIGSQTAPMVEALVARADENSGSGMYIGNGENDVAILTILSKDEVKDTTIINSSMMTVLKTDKLTAGDWALTYVLVKGNSTLEAPVALEDGKMVVSPKSAAKLTVEADSDDVPADGVGAPSITFSPANTNEVESGQEIELTYESGAFNELVWKTFPNIAAAKSEEPTMMWSIYPDFKPQVTVENPVLVIGAAVSGLNYEYKYYRVYNVKAAVVTEVATPTFEMETDGDNDSVGGTCQIEQGKSMFIRCETAGAKIRYTIDGTDIAAATDGLEYQGWVTINSACTLRAKAFVGDIASEQASIEVLIKRDTVKVSLNATKWKMGTTVPRFSISIDALGESMVMGTGENNVGVLAILKQEGVAKDTQLITTASVNLKTDKLTVGEWTLEYELVKGNSTLTAPVAFEGDAVISTTSTTLTVEKGTVATPTFSSRSGEVDSNTLVSINCTTPGAKIYYTTDTTTPTTASILYDADTKIRITKAIRIKAFAVKDGWNDSPVDSVDYAIAVLPEDESIAPAITLNPDVADSVDNNTEILVSTEEEGYDISFGTFSSIVEAKQASRYDFKVYGKEGYPVVTEEEPILVVTMGKQVSIIYREHKYYRYYKVRPASPVAMPEFMTATGVQGGLVPRGTRLQIIAEQGTIWYTTDGSKPAENGANSIKGEMEGEDGAGANLIINSAMTVKAIVVVDGVSSDVNTTRFQLFEDIDATLKVGLMDTVVGKNTGVGLTIASEALGEEASQYVYRYPFTVYYTLDGQTEPSQEAYWNQEDPENGVIKMVASQVDDEGYPVMDENTGNVVELTFAEGPVQLKAKGYMMLGESTESGQIITTLFDKTIEVESEENPTFSINSGTVVKVGDTLTIGNPGSEEDYSFLYFSFDGTKPTSAAYYAQEYGDPYNIFKTPFEGEDVKIIFGKDEKGFYANVPAIGDLLSNHKQDTIRFENDRFSVEVFCESAMETDIPSEWGWGYQTMPYGSDFVKATYFSSIPDTVKAPTFSVEAGAVLKGTEVELASETGDAKIYYTTNGDAPTEASTLYSSKIVINEAMTIKAIAVKEGMISSKVSEAAYTVKEAVPDTVKAPTFSEQSGEVEKGTKVTLESETDDAKIYYTIDGTVPTTASTEYTAAISIDSAMTIKAIAVKEGMVNSKVSEASYTIKVANEGKELAGVNIYPNPNDGEFYVSVPVNAKVEIFAANGTLINRFAMAAGQREVRLPNSGIYFVRFTAENGQVAVRRVIVR